MLPKEQFYFVLDYSTGSGWCYQTPFDGWWRGGTPRIPNSRATPQALDIPLMQGFAIHISFIRSPKIMYDYLLTHNVQIN